MTRGVFVHDEFAGHGGLALGGGTVEFEVVLRVIEMIVHGERIPGPRYARMRVPQGHRHARLTGKEALLEYDFGLRLAVVYRNVTERETLGIEHNDAHIESWTGQGEMLPLFEHQILKHNAAARRRCEARRRAG